MTSLCSHQQQKQQDSFSFCMGRKWDQNLAKLWVIPPCPHPKESRFSKIFLPEYTFYKLSGEQLSKICIQNSLKCMWHLPEEFHVLHNHLYSRLLFPFFTTECIAFKRELNHFWTRNYPLLPTRLLSVWQICSLVGPSLPQAACSLVMGLFQKIYIFAQNHRNEDMNRLEWSWCTLSIHRRGTWDSENTSGLPKSLNRFKATEEIRTQGP